MLTNIEPKKALKDVIFFIVIEDVNSFWKQESALV